MALTFQKLFSGTRTTGLLLLICMQLLPLSGSVGSEFKTESDVITTVVVVVEEEEAQGRVDKLKDRFNRAAARSAL